RLMILETMARMTKPASLDAWREALTRSLRDSQTRLQAARTIGALGTSDFDAELKQAAESDGPADFRIEALRALSPRHPKLAPASLDLLLDQFRGKAASPLRLAAAEVLRHSQLDSAGLTSTLAAVRG